MNRWQKMIVELKDHGFTQKQIAEKIGCSQNYVSNLENGLCGKRLGYDKGRNLENLWVEHTQHEYVA
ncbi:MULTISPECIES: helix-turn-helix transcriptional regulator [unclassified Acinetobacter]|uniref:helix-turn-helix domain-containing protein n=1 Tax=unclassified Acinetobacter TaxID=196816 RepID=UPI002934D0A8|nr:MULTISPECIES: helix-turn-helix transcriptional regulator [unclassified Acinetobacter]WOE32151.1 helix-turn-helix transcriptional regulator [Acinetobacter sp. SAAs470]WOE37621.1 helix-turn-helix transcriptional regulator [Acinetobacter sp. SAAs474]